MREEPEALAPARRLAIGRELIPFAPVLGDRLRDGVVQTAIESAELLGRGLLASVSLQLGQRLADVAIAVNDLRDCGSPVPVNDPRGWPPCLRLRVGPPLTLAAHPQCDRQLIQEERGFRFPALAEWPGELVATPPWPACAR